MTNRIKTHKLTLVEQGKNKLKTAVVATAGPLTPVGKSPDESMGALFDDVQKAGVFTDGKTFLDMIPRKQAKALKKEYEIRRFDPNFKVRDFVNKYFYVPHSYWDTKYSPAHTTTARQHVTHLWRVLRRRNRRNRGSLIALPYDYIVPGGRFSEQFYWDSYFIMLGLAADNEWTLLEGMVKNHAYMLRKFGMIPTANRTYFLSRSQPPFFSQMVVLLAKHKGYKRTLVEYIPALLSEYRFWMKGRRVAAEHKGVYAFMRSVSMPNGVVLNRYYDNKVTPRPESLREDVATAALSKAGRHDRIFLDLRAGAESGWDFSSRWLRTAHDLTTIHTSDIVPIDLNCMLYKLEQTIAEVYTILLQPLVAQRFKEAAERRADTIRTYFWSQQQGMFTDYDSKTHSCTEQATLAGVFPLFVHIATDEQAQQVAHTIEQRFLKEGGLVTTLEKSGQQWDAPNGWAPLQWVAIMGLREYGYHALADTIRDKWLKTCDDVFRIERRMLEKYNVVTPGAGAGGEYPLQDGFGWTNGVYAALHDEQRLKNKP